MAKGHKGHHHRKAMGGSVEKGAEHDFTPAAPETKEAKEKDSGFKKGGKVGGRRAHKRMDKRPRKAAGGAVMSSASKTTEPKMGGTMVDA